MNVLGWIGLVAAVWFAVALVLGLRLGPVLKRNAERYPLPGEDES